MSDWSAVDRLEDRRMKVSVFLIALALLAASPSFAEHATLASGVAPEGHDLEIELKIGQDFLRLGGHVLGPGGVASGWLNGRLRPGGFIGALCGYAGGCHRAGHLLQRRRDRFERNFAVRTDFGGLAGADQRD